MKTTTVLNVRISIELKEWLHRDAARRGVTASALTKQLIGLYRRRCEAAQAIKRKRATAKAKAKPESRSKAAVKATALKRKERVEQAAAARVALVQEPPPVAPPLPAKALTLSERRALMKAPS